MDTATALNPTAAATTTTMAILPTTQAPSSSSSSPSFSGGAPPSERTFTKYTATQAASYLAGRRAYPDALTQTVLTHHTGTGGQLETLLDVGCGPGTATRSFAPHFRRAFGVDPSVEMVNAARAAGAPAIPSPSPTPPPDPPGRAPVTYAISTAEALPGPSLAATLQPGSVDLLTAATAAHWFDMARFWPRAAALVAPGGTVALWTGASYYCHPHTTPGAARVQAVLDALVHGRLAPYAAPGNVVSDGLYRELGLPWDAGVAAEEFPREEFVRREWDVGGQVGVGETFFRGHERVSLEDFAQGLATASMVTRWREAHPELVGTEDDVVAVTVRELREALGGREWFEGGSATALLMFKRR